MLAIIPAKKKSVRLKNKNLKLFYKYPLIVHTIKSAKKSKFVKRIIVSTDSKKIAKIAKKFGAEIPFLRNRKYSKNNTTSWEVIKNVIKNLILKEKKFYESFIYLQPTSPLRTYKDIDNAINLFIKKKANAVVSVTKSKPNSWYKNISKKGILINKKNDSKKNYILNGALYVFKTSYIFKSKPYTYDKKTFAYIMPEERSVDIDTINDFKSAKAIYKK